MYQSREEVFVHETSVIDSNVSIGNGTKIWCFSHVQEDANIGEYCIIGQNVNISHGVKIGNYVKIQNNVSVYSGVELEDYVFCGPSCVFSNDIAPRSKYPKGVEHYKKTYVREGASIGANATVVCGHTIGKCAFVAAGAVVTSDVPDYALMIGIPARQKGWVCECGGKLNDFLKCTICGRTYQKSKSGLQECEV